MFISHEHIIVLYEFIFHRKSYDLERCGNDLALIYAFIRRVLLESVNTELMADKTEKMPFCSYICNNALRSCDEKISRELA